MNKKTNLDPTVYALEGRDGVEADVPKVGNSRVADGAGLESGAAKITAGTG
jgi:hypothetical protein